MKITLISPYPDITSFGIRTISSYLKHTGHHTRLIFLPDPCGDNITHGVQRYDESVLDGIIPLCDDSDIIGITLMTNFFEGAVQITRKIKTKLDKPIIWGGIHPTVSPETCLQYADMVCIGDGEDAISELLCKMQENENYTDTKNFWFKRDGTVIKNPLRPLQCDIDLYPMPDYSLEDHYLMFENKIRIMTPELQKISFEQKLPLPSNKFKYYYQTMTGRGCPHKCTYCINDTLKNMYDGQGYLRWRSTGHFINELLWVKKNMPYVDHIWFSDDAFFAKNNQKIEEFSRQYKDKIGLPFFALASPITLTEEKMAMLVDAGLICIQMGIETASKRTQELFNRKQMNNERIMKAVRIINKYKDKILPPHYDFILDTPYETDDDKMETLRFISRMPKPFILQTFSLVLYPGTQLYKLAKKDGLIKDEMKEIINRSYTRRKSDYINLLYAFAKKGTFPGWLLRLLASAPLVKVLNSRAMRPFIRYSDIILRNILHRIKNLLRHWNRSAKAQA